MGESLWGTGRVWEELTPCELCGEPTPSLGTRRCDRCWELETRIERDLELVEKILHALRKRAQNGHNEK